MTKELMRGRRDGHSGAGGGAVLMFLFLSVLIAPHQDRVYICIYTYVYICYLPLPPI